MKKILLCGSLFFLLISCGYQKEKNVVSEKEEEIKTEITEKKTKEIKELKTGETITTPSAEITIEKIEFNYDVKPEKAADFYTHYPAESGKVYIDIVTNVKNIQKQQLRVDKIMGVKADYNGGYEYNANPVPESNGDFSYANIVSIDPLTSYKVRYIILVPQEVEEKPNPVKIIFNIENETYEYKMK